MNMDFSSLYGQYDFSSMEEKFESLFPTWDISFRELILEVMKGNGAEVITGQVKEIFYLLLMKYKNLLFYYLIWG